jgi:tetratricopeptide (TPR) repeat protein
VVSSDTPIEELQQRCKEHPEELGNVLDLVQRYSSLGWYNEALELCRSMMKLHARAYSFLLEFANVLYKRSDFKEARMVFKRLTELKPERIEAWNNLGILELSSGNPEEANRAFRKVLEFEPHNAGALCNTGNYFAEKGDAALAATYFERAIEARHDFTEAWYNLGNSYMSLSQFKEAKEAFEKAIYYDGFFGSAYKNLGFVCEQLDDCDGALECYAKAASLNKADAGIQVNMSGIYMRREEYDKALECGKRAASLAPGEPSSWSALRTAAMQLGDGRTYYRAVTALISTIDDNDLARGIADLREMGFDQEAAELLEYSVKINRGSVSVDALPFAESKAPKFDEGAVNQRMYKIINNKKGGKKRS